jgi:hypothetical protein
MSKHVFIYRIYTFIIFLYLPISNGLAQINSYPDQHYIIERGDSLFFYSESASNIEPNEDGSKIQLSDSAMSGSIVLKPQTALHPFNIGLPSWNGTVPGNSGAFRIQVRIPYQSDWSPWLDVGFWKANQWPGTKKTSYNGGRVDIDILVLYSYATRWQFRVEMKRDSAAVSSPTLSLLSFFVSDERTTQTYDFSAVMADNPAPIFVPTTFLAQYRISDEFGGRICSPTTVSMILLSYGIEVNPFQFALDTYDPYWEIFGVWPRVVQNASEYGLKGTVTRYRTWSQARDVLANGGRIGMSIGQPLYGGHLVMLAGFTENGDPIVHDPARTYDGYAHVFHKNDLSHAWFDKGGVAYTFYLRDSSKVTSIHLAKQENSHEKEPSFVLYPNYPNPFNASTTFYYELKKDGFIEFSIFNILGELIKTVESEYKYAGEYQLQWDGRNSLGVLVASGEYIYQIRFKQNEVKAGKLLLVR